MAEMDENMLIPDCTCGAGKMSINCAGPLAANYGRYYYKCPTGESHKRSFFWCDEFHRNHPPEFVPQFLSLQTLKSGASTSQTQTDCNAKSIDQKETKAVPRAETTCCAESEEMTPMLQPAQPPHTLFICVCTCIVTVFMCFILILLGVILGKVI